MTRISALSFTVCTLILVGTNAAQDRLAAQTYGQGVHAFYRGQSSQANRLFNDAIQSGFEDPRVYYFRAISKMKSGDMYGAEADIRMGATLEVSGSGAYDVGRALERFQGHQRVKFEAVRREARMEAMRAQANQPQPELPPVAPAPTRDYMEAPPAAPTESIPPAPVDAQNPFLDDESDAVLDDVPAADSAPGPDAADEDMGDIFGEDTMEGHPHGRRTPRGRRRRRRSL